MTRVRSRRGVRCRVQMTICAIASAVAISPPTDAANLAVASRAGASEARRDDASVLFAAARIVPDDVSFYVHVEDAVAIRDRHGDRPIAELLEASFESSSVAGAWARLVGRSGVGSKRLLASLLGGRATLVGRTAAEGGRSRDGEPGLEWALILEADRADFRRFLRAWRPERLWPGGLAVEAWRFREGDIRVYAFAETIVLGGDGAPRLVEQVARRLHQIGGSVPRVPAGVLRQQYAGRSASEAADQQLWHHEGLRLARELGVGSVAAWFAHGDQGGGGWSAFVIDALTSEPDRIRVAWHATFDGPPFERPVPEISWSESIVDALAGDAIAVVAEPTDIGWGRAGAWLSRSIEHPLLSGPLQAQVQSRRLYVLGEIDGRTLDPPLDVMLPAGAVVIEVDDADLAATNLDLHLASILGGLRNDGLRLDRSITLDGTGFAELGPSIERWWRGGDPAATAPPVPLRGVAVSWAVASTPQSAWMIVASHPGLLAIVRNRLEEVSASADAGAERSPWASCGAIRGIAAASLLRDLSEPASVLAIAGSAADAARIRQSLAAMASAFSVADRIGWRMRRPDSRSVRADLEIILAPPPTVTVRRSGS